MDREKTLQDTAEVVLNTLPCSVCLPAGCGKTELIAAVALRAANSSMNSLVLTHTHAGVDALRKRFEKFHVDLDRVTVQTIDSWCFDLIRHRPQLAQIDAPEIPNWDDSAEYHIAAARAVNSSPVQSMISASYSILIVDEYQDCLIDQHEVVVAISHIIPTVVLGDPLQGLFKFGNNNPVDWKRDVTARFPSVEVSVLPWRWQSANQALGAWLLEVRSDIQAGRGFPLDRSIVSWIESDEWAALTACNSLLSKEGSVAALGRFRSDCVATARRLSGKFGIMEEIEGKEMMAFAKVVDGKDASAISSATVEFAISCSTGVADFFPTSVRTRLREGIAIKSRKEEIRLVTAPVNLLLTEPSVSNVKAALVAISEIPGLSMYCREKWDVVVSALSIAERGGNVSTEDAVRRLRDNIRMTGRKYDSRIISRPLLVKGLEYGHVALLNSNVYSSAELYVAMTRGKHSLTVVSNSATLTPRK